jgi:hypothetical protein
MPPTNLVTFTTLPFMSINCSRPGLAFGFFPEELMISGSLWSFLCASTKVGSEISAHHLLDTHRSRHANLTGTLERISKIRSHGNKATAVVAPSAGSGVQMVPPARELGRRWRLRLGDLCGGGERWRWWSRGDRGRLVEGLGSVRAEFFYRSDRVTSIFTYWIRLVGPTG